MVDESSIGIWLSGLREGDPAAMQAIWERFFKALVASAERSFGHMLKPRVDGEDIAASVMESLWKGYQEGRFEDVNNRSELLATLLKMTTWKCISYMRRDQATKRGGATKTLSIEYGGLDNREIGDAIFSQIPDPQYVAIVNDELENAFAALPDATQRKIAALRIEGYTAREISVEMGIAVATVHRKLKLIRDKWERGATHGSGEWQ